MSEAGRFIWSIWSISFVLLPDPEKPNNQINKTNQTNQLNETDQINKRDQPNR
jgi:hypothetical protein